MAMQQREISVSEFFTKNRHLLGFDNPNRALLTTVKEAVDNSLDACEEAGILPDVDVVIQQADGGENRFRVTVTDNGPGIVKAQIPRIFGKLLYGSKFHRLKMSRGQQGIGISAAGMYGNLTTGKPVVVTSKTAPSKRAHYYELVINTKDNEPRIIKEDTVDTNGWQGTSVQIELEGSFHRGKWSVEEYLEQTAVANPHVNLSYRAPDGQVMRLTRAFDELPDEPVEIKPHPHGIELGMLIRMLNETKTTQLKTFLRTDFSRVSRRAALEICRSAGIYENARPRRIAREEADKLLKAMREAKIMSPPLDCISPIGEGQILVGMKSAVEADFHATVTRSPSVYRGIPFLVEAGIAYGGKLSADKAARLMRFANRVPLLYNAGGCAITESVCSTNWRQYGLEQSNGSMPVGPLLVVVHLASAWAPFTSESKEAIAAYPEIEKEIRLALQECARKLRLHIRRTKRRAEEKRKSDYIQKYIPHISEALQEILAFPDEERDKIVKRLTGVLEASRKP